MGKKKEPSFAAAVREHFIGVFKYLSKEKKVSAYAHALATNAGIALAQLDSARPDEWNVKIKACPLDIKSSSTRGQQDCVGIVIGGEFEAKKGSLVRHSVPVNILLGARCFAHDPPWCAQPADSADAISARRVHFDFDAGVTKWPKHHLQVGGNAAELSDAGTYHYAVSEDPSEPRIPMASLDFVLALDLMMREFPTGLDLPQEPAWRAHVMRSEALFLKPYFAEAHAHLQSAAPGKIPLIEYLAR